MRSIPLLPMWLLCVAMPSCDKMDSSINRGLEEEKSYSRHAMEYHRQHPDKRRGDRVLETWSTTDYVAQAVAANKTPGDWARFSDQMDFLKPTIKTDPSGRAFCVVQHSGSIVVLSYVTDPPSTCTLQSILGLDTSRIQTGDMEFSGRTDFWVYVLRP
jgi:hypothetical protein